MDAPSFLILARTIISIVLAVGGIVALCFGYFLFRSGIGLSEDGTTIKWKKVKIHLKTVGSVLMLTSFSWGWFSLSAMPKTFTTNSAGDTKVTQSFNQNTPLAVDISVLPVLSKTRTDNIDELPPKEILTQFFEAKKSVEINGRNARLVKFDWAGKPNGQKEISSIWKVGENGSVFITFKPSLKGEYLNFVQAEGDIFANLSDKPSYNANFEWLVDTHKNKTPVKKDPVEDAPAPPPRSEDAPSSGVPATDFRN